MNKILMLALALMLRVWWDPCMFGCDQRTGVVLGAAGDVYSTCVLVRLDNGKVECVSPEKVTTSKWEETVVTK